MRNGLFRVVKWLISGAKIAAFRDKHCGSGDYYILHITFFAFLDFIITHQARHYVKFSNTEKIIYIFIYYI